ncbi:MAG TPA: beta-L-arabinofuranosidase domain-containing protein [Puia sp.]|uniref:beta-L-arabinofuranosidase domain-containing protein n=1 Tax=Puia sp. TaxID=2045100 RepID=UPI002BD03214|nr:beta-L-arabinofuranosidase domain-containing protein [Puia sp.]HVU95379.1 beta-L-arabinofuranosidase domain-containing protein [Puia sp.]
MNKLLLRIALIVAAWATGGLAADAQNGDQLLDGIGETGMAARYVFDGDARDWSRNNLHARVQGGEFVNDSRWGKVLSLSGAGFVTIPGEALADVESLSISGWIYLRTNQPGQRLFDVGKDANRHFSMAVPPAVKLNTWVHWVLVVDVPSRWMMTYVDGKAVGEARPIPKEFGEVTGKQSGGNLLYVGRSLLPGEPLLNAMIHDFRIYRVPLSGGQVAGIYNNGLRGRGINDGVVNTTGRRGPAEDLPHFSPAEARLYNAWLTGVSNVEVGTTVGTLPRLPSYVSGTYTGEMKGKGPKVRVIWPFPTDNHDVLAPGRYTIVGRVPGTEFQPKAFVTVKGVTGPVTPGLKLATFDLGRVTLNTDGHGHATQFIANRDKFIDTLAKTDPNSFLYMFRHAFGQPQPEGAEPLGVWDSRDTKLRGHATGHYLSAIAQAYASTGYDKALQANFAAKMEYMVGTLYDLSQLSGKAKEPGGEHVADPAAVPVGPGKRTYDSDLSDTGIRHDYWNWGTGFISAYPPDQFIMLEHGAKYGGQKTSIWAPYYTLHKILAGLLDVYEVSGNKKALAIATGMGNWVYARLSRVPTDTLIKMWNTYIAGEYGGMNEVMARLYRITGDANYLKTAHLFDNIRVFFGDTAHSNGLAKNVDVFRGLHANQHIPQIIGSMEMYRDSHDPAYYTIADNFWYKAVNDYMYSIGGVAGARNPNNAECFISTPGTLYENGFSAGGQNETCATYNMLKLTSDLFLFDPRGELMDYYERALYNDILASVAENSPANTYHIPLRPGSIKQFGNPDMTGFTCCNGTALESNTKLQNSIYFKSVDDGSLYVNLYIPSTLDWKERNIRIEQVTDYPNADNTRLMVRGSGKFDLHVRVPGWATHGFFVNINGKRQTLPAVPGSYLAISRVWKDGDVVELRMPFAFHLDPVMDQPNIASLFYGPILLAAQEPEARKDWRKITLDAEDIGKTIKGDPAKLEFTVDDAVFKPFYETYGRHSVYLDVRLK